MASEDQFELATFGGGCFWCTKAVFGRVKGVKFVTSGYPAGEIKTLAIRYPKIKKYVSIKRCQH